MERGRKTFPCTATDCLLSFKTEDHLNVHSKKHEMNLNLEIPSKLNLFSDQTPTPTRLIGKCEEVGLFEDLRHVNPFDETFRRAVESRTTSGDGAASDTAAIGTVSDGDTLHTPHIFPPVAEVKTVPDKDGRTGKHRVSKLTVTSRTGVPRRADSATSGAVQTAVKRKVDSMVSILPKPAPVAESQPVRVVSCGNEHRKPAVIPVKAKLKEHIVRNIKGEPQKVTIQQDSSNGVIEASMQKDTQPFKVPSCLDKDESSQRHERSKAAAQRYRARVKQDQARLHKKNLDLEEENLNLKTELKKLRRALALHRDCSVTRAMKVNAQRFVPTVAMKSEPSQILPVNVNPIFIVLNRSAPTVSADTVDKKDDAT